MLDYPEKHLPHTNTQQYIATTQTTAKRFSNLLTKLFFIILCETNGLDCLFPSGLIFVCKAGILPKGAPLYGQASGLTRKLPKTYKEDKRSSLFFPTVSNEEKKFEKIDTLDQCYKTSLIVTDAVGKEARPFVRANSNLV
jgi:hypothetical protein